MAPKIDCTSPSSVSMVISMALAPETLMAPAPDTSLAPTPDTSLAPAPDISLAPAPDTSLAPAPETSPVNDCKDHYDQPFSDSDL